MARLLYIQSSPREESRSSALAREYLSAFLETHPWYEVDSLNLWETELPRFDGRVLKAKYRLMTGQTQSAAEVVAWQAVVSVAEQFKAADAYLFSIPMWNFSIPYVLKHYIDVITQPGVTFSFSPERGYEGLVTGRPATLIYARGGEYSEQEGGRPDTNYMNQILGFIGIEEIRTIIVEPTLGDEVHVAERWQAALDQARLLATGQENAVYMSS